MTSPPSTHTPAAAEQVAVCEDEPSHLSQGITIQHLTKVHHYPLLGLPLFHPSFTPIFSFLPPSPAIYPSSLPHSGTQRDCVAGVSMFRRSKTSPLTFTRVRSQLCLDTMEPARLQPCKENPYISCSDTLCPDQFSICPDLQVSGDRSL